jgi:hypothetical protein
MIIRTNDDGTLDEVIGAAHLEQMDDHEWCLIFDGPPRVHLSLCGCLIVIEGPGAPPWKSTDCSGCRHEESDV